MGRKDRSTPDSSPKRGNCPAGGDHNWVHSGHDVECTKCGQRTAVH